MSQNVICCRSLVHTPKGDNMLNEARSILISRYEEIRGILFEMYPYVSPTKLGVTDREECSVFSVKDNAIVLNFPELNLGDVIEDEHQNLQTLLAQSQGPPAWLRELIHETIHAFEHRVICQSTTTEGKELFTQVQAARCGPIDAQHAGPFYSAVHHAASTLGIEPLQFIKNCL